MDAENQDVRIELDLTSVELHVLYGLALIGGCVLADDTDNAARLVAGIVEHFSESEVDATLDKVDAAVKLCRDAGTLVNQRPVS
jgi:hypothetical protein